MVTTTSPSRARRTTSPGTSSQVGTNTLCSAGRSTAAVDLPDERKVFVPSWEDVPGEVVARVRDGDVVVTMGAPPISLMGDELLAALAETQAEQGN